jgi:hypothetical protein
MLVNRWYHVMEMPLKKGIPIQLQLAEGCNPVLAWLQVAGELWLADGCGLLAGLLIGSAW